MICVIPSPSHAACVQSLINEDFCVGEEPTDTSADGVSNEIIIAVVVVVLVLTGVAGKLTICVFVLLLCYIIIYIVVY